MKYLLFITIVVLILNVNNFSQSFTQTGIELRPMRYASIDWGDYDNDGDLDIAICGTDTSNTFGECITLIYKNNLNVPNNAPAKPIISNALVNGSDVSFERIASSDDHTPQSSLSYNLRIGTAPGGSDFLNPMADENNGFRKLHSMGNTNFNINWEILNLEDGLYYWSVQAIDGAMAVSEFSGEGIFTVGSVTLSENESLPQKYKLKQNFPNPFNPIIKIRFTIPTSTSFPLLGKERDLRVRLISLRVYDVLGNEVATLVNKEKQAGEYEIEFDAKDLTSGVCFYSMTVGSFTDTKKIILLR